MGAKVGASVIKEFKEIKKHLSNEFIIREKKESIAGEDENKEL